MDLSSFAKLSIVEQQEATRNHVAKRKRRAVDQVLAPAEEDANAICAHEEAERMENALTQEKEPRSSDNSTTTNPVQELAKALHQRLPQQAWTSTNNEEGDFVSYRLPLQDKLCERFTVI